MARSTTPAGYAEDLRRAARKLKKPATQAKILGQDPEWMKLARATAAENNQRVFASRGQYNAHPFPFRRDYVETGKMRNELTGGQGAHMRSRVNNRGVAFTGRVKYFKYWSRGIMGWGVRSARQVADVTARYLAKLASGPP